LDCDSKSRSAAGAIELVIDRPPVKRSGAMIDTETHAPAEPQETTAESTSPKSIKRTKKAVRRKAKPKPNPASKRRRRRAKRTGATPKPAPKRQRRRIKRRAGNGHPRSETASESKLRRAIAEIGLTRAREILADVERAFRD
jgi:hypothetical protein